MPAHVLRCASWILSGLLALVLSACGGGGGGSSPPATPTGTLSGTVRASATAAAVPNATVRAGSLSTVTGADGRFSLAGVPAAARVVLTVEASGFVDGKVTAPVLAEQTTTVSASLITASPPVTLDATVASTVTVPGSSASVALPANGLVLESTGTAPSGAVQARVTPIDPAADPQSMPGDYTAAGDQRIESFGAIEVRLTDANGAALNLRPGSSATIRIPLASRSASPPATIPLYFFNETTGLWVQEGTATLQGVAPNQYYEGTVTHFSFWNADQPMDTIFVNGCVNDTAGRPVSNATVQTTGVDYTGSAAARSDAQGRFRVAMRRAGVAKLWAEGINQSNTVQVGPSTNDISLANCLVLSDELVAPEVVQGPRALTVEDGASASFTVVASGSQPLRYQWLRNGTPIEGAVFEFLRLPAVSRAADNGARFSVRVGNDLSEITSAEAVLTVNPPLPPSITRQPANASVLEGATARFSVAASGSAPLSFEWLRNGQVIEGAVTAQLDFPATLANNGDRFSVRVTNRAEAVLSNEAVLTVTATPLQITTQPVSTTAFVGAQAIFSVAAVGSPPITYQWFRDNAEIPGATQASYTTPAVQASDNGAVFRVEVRSGTQTALSNTATLTVSTAPPSGEADKFQRLMSLIDEFSVPAFVVLDIIGPSGTTFADPAAACAIGNATFTLNGAPIVAGGAVPLQGTLAASANDCGIFGTVVSLFDGSASLTYQAQTLNPANASFTGTYGAARQTTRVTFGGTTTILTDNTSDGGLAFSVAENRSPSQIVTTSTFTPALNATIRNELTGRTARFVSGSVTTVDTTPTATTGVETLRRTFNDLRITLGGVTYTLRGTTESSFGTSSAPDTGEVLLLIGTTQVGRAFYDTQGDLQFDIQVTLQPF